MKTLIPFLAIASMIGLTACSDDNNDRDPQSQVRVIHASPDAPAVNVMVNGGALAEDLDYTEATEITTVNSGTYTVQVDGILPGDSLATVIGPVDLTFSENIRYNIIAVDDLDMIEPIIVETSTSFDSSMVRVSIAHLAPDVGMVDVYVTAPTATIAESTKVATLDFKDDAEATVPPGDYRIRITVAGDTAPVYDSGETGISLSAGTDLIVGAFENTQMTDSGAMKSPVNLQVINGSNSVGLFSTDDGADLRVVHASSDAPAVDVAVNDNFTPPLVDNLAFTEFTPAYVNTPADSYDITVAADADNSVVAIDVDGLALADGGVYTVLAVGELVDDIKALVVSDMPRSIATAAQVRILHASVLAGNVDVYVTADGAGISGATPVLTNVTFEGDSGYLSLSAGSYDVIVTPTGTTTAAISADLDNLMAGEIYTAVAVDGANSSTPLGLILMDSFVP